MFPKNEIISFFGGIQFSLFSCSFGFCWLVCEVGGPAVVFVDNVFPHLFPSLNLGLFELQYLSQVCGSRGFLGTFLFSFVTRRFCYLLFEPVALFVFAHQDSTLFLFFSLLCISLFVFPISFQENFRFEH